jgi:hypothetical protein
MEAFEKPKLHASAAQNARMNDFAAITALRNQNCFGQSGSYPASKPLFFVFASNLSGPTGIYFKRQLRDLYSPRIVRVAFYFVRNTSIKHYLACFRFGGLYILRLLHRLGADCLPALLGHNCRVFPSGVPLQAPISEVL